ncbi:hypothetical protein [Vibrio sp. MEBiC08052]|uniref:hypothetical protein n=1 Tax=Vibrio sp. MEBiC08052 TaxID=1761910 RepID=UPI000740601B|nr:hypothetical protein [Vibrio sp. MEBiC08052]KUI96885.1 hypothetical protein VRK_40660 [Vibrio sp. MEBiC08052]
MSETSLQPSALRDLVQENSIAAGPLPPQQDVTFLKQEGIRQLKSQVGHIWSNFNDSDPGVTILEQLCYALTELGYVNSFPIADVLTQSDGQIDYAQQFFRAEEILTTAPVTIDDYRKLVLDRIDAVENIYLTPLTIASQPTGLYQVAVYVRHESSVVVEKATEERHGVESHAGETGSSAPNRQTEKTAADTLIQSVHRLLNRHRNLGEYFLLPVLLQPQVIALSGQILLAPDADPHQVAGQIDLALADYVSPPFRQQGYQQLTKAGYGADSIFNGPLLQHGWHCCEKQSTAEWPVSGLGEKRQEVRLIDLMSRISEVPGVAVVARLAFCDEPSCQSVAVAADKVAAISLSDDFQMQSHQVSLNVATQWERSRFLTRLHARHQASPVDASVDIAPPLPQGRYRNIESYYSLQHTFPTSYGVGANSLQSDISDFRVAQARQLKGYLLLFDQVMANQFSQLANLGHLFSFSFGSGASAENTLIERYTQNRADPQRMAIPSQSFVRSYFYQPLYDVPDVQALLQGKNRYQYFYPDDPDEPKQREKLVWQRFRRDPFNTYAYGLNQCTETPEEAEQRRDAMLSHLLARHGEPADRYDEIIDGCQWFGGHLRTRIIIKGVWLQNLQALSYRRNLAGDFSQAQPLTTPGRYRLETQAYRQLMVSRYSNALAPLLRGIYRRGFIDQKTLIATMAQARIAHLRAVLVKQGQADQAIHHDQVVKRCQAIAASLPLQDGNQQLLESEQTQYKALMRDGVLDAGALDQFVKLTDQDYADFSVFELKCAILLGIARHLQTLATALVRLTQVSEFLRWLAADPQVGERFPEQHAAANMADTLRDISVLRQTDALVVQIGTQPVLRLPWTEHHFGRVQLQQYIDQLDWLGRVRRGFVLIEQTLLQPDPSLTKNEPTEEHEQTSPDDAIAVDVGEGLLATLAFPDYVVLMQQPQFQTFLAEMVQFHWPAHVRLQWRQGSYRQMSTLIACYCQWYNRQIHQTNTSLCNALAPANVNQSDSQAALLRAISVMPEVPYDQA